MLRLLLAASLTSIVFTAACSRPEPPKYDVGNAQVQGHYDRKTGKLTSITYDSNKNGKTDTWSYMDGTTVLRVEIDKDEDGKIDRWEYYTADKKLEKVGYSRANNGKADAWAYQGPDGTTAKIEFAGAPPASVGPDLQVGATSIARTEFYENDVLVRVEADTNADGKVDKWETYANGALASVALDTTGDGTPDRRLIYGPNGSVKVETDPAGTGAFKLPK